MLALLKVFLTALFELIGPMILNQLDRADTAERVSMEGTDEVRDRLLREVRDFGGI